MNSTKGPKTSPSGTFFRLSFDDYWAARLDSNGALQVKLDLRILIDEQLCGRTPARAALDRKVVPLTMAEALALPGLQVNAMAAFMGVSKRTASRRRRAVRPLLIEFFGYIEQESVSEACPTCGRGVAEVRLHLAQVKAIISGGGVPSLSEACPTCGLPLSAPFRSTRARSDFRLQTTDSDFFKEKTGRWDGLAAWFLKVPAHLRDNGDDPTLNLLSAVAQVISTESLDAQSPSVGDELATMLNRWHQGDAFGPAIYARAARLLDEGLGANDLEKLRCSLASHGDPGGLTSSLLE